MSENCTRYVKFLNDTDEPVTFVWRDGHTPRQAFTLQPRRVQGNSHQWSHGIYRTYEELHMLKGADSNGRSTDQRITTDALADLEKVIVTKTDNYFHLTLHRRKKFSWIETIKTYLGFGKKEESKPSSVDSSSLPNNQVTV